MWLLDGATARVGPRTRGFNPSPAPLKKMPRWVESGWFFFRSARAVARVFIARATALAIGRTVARSLLGGFFFNGLPRWVFLQTRVGAGWANRVNGFGPGQPMGQKILTGWVTARVFNGSIILFHHLFSLFINKWQNFLTYKNWIFILF
jgi:hypothetical protein